MAGAATLILPGIAGAAAYSPDFDLYLYDPSGTLVAAAETVERQETVGFKPSATGTYTGTVRSCGAGHLAADDNAYFAVVSIYNWTTGVWTQLDSRSVGTSEVQLDRSVSGTFADYVSGASGDGDVAVRIRCSRSSGSFYTSADLLRITYQR
jgi:hypothetical protein